MTSIPLVLENEPLGIILRTGRPLLRPAKIWAYCWCLDQAEDGSRPHEHIPVDPNTR